MRFQLASIVALVALVGLVRAANPASMINNHLPTGMQIPSSVSNMIPNIPNMPDMPNMPHMNMPHMNMPHMNVPHMNVPHMNVPHMNVPQMNFRMPNTDINQIPTFQQMMQYPQQMWQMLSNLQQMIPLQMQQMMNQLPVNPMSMVNGMSNRLQSAAKDVTKSIPTPSK